MATCIGVISDTHNLLREEVKNRLRGCDLIIHAGDVGSRTLLAELRNISGLVVVRGNVDSGSWARELNMVEELTVEGRHIRVVHDLSTLRIDQAAGGVDAVIYGHSHQPVITHQDGVLYLNPGSAGPARFNTPVSMALLRVNSDGLFPQLIDL